MVEYSTEQSAQKKKLFSASLRIKYRLLYITFNALYLLVLISKISCISYNLNIRIYIKIGLLKIKCLGGAEGGRT